MGFLKKDGSIRVKVISPGFGSSGYYPPKTLETAAAKFANAQSFWDHPSASEESDRPERSLRDLAGKIVGTPTWEANGTTGPGIYADVQVFGPYQSAVEELAPHIGMSIRALGKAGTAEVDGKKVRSIESIDDVRSVDFVTMPGRGGEILQLFESARSGAKPKQESERTDEVDKAEFDATTTALAEAQTKLAALEQWKTDQEQRDQTAKLMREASAVVTEALASMQLPESVRTKVTTELTLNPPLKEGAIDNEALTAKAKERATEEYTYVIEAAGLTGRVIGMGGGPSDVDPKAELASLFEAQGYSKDVAARMAAR